MDFSLDTNYKARFSDGFEILAQQMKSVFESTVTIRPPEGEYLSEDLIDAVSLSARTGDKEALAVQDPTHTRRHMTYTTYDTVLPVEMRDLVRLQKDPTNKYVQELVAAYKRKFDELALSRILGTVLTGKGIAGTLTTTAYDTANQTLSVKYQAGDPVGTGNGTAAAATGLTIDKLLKARGMILNAYGLKPGETLWCAIDVEDEISLLKTSEFNGRDFVRPEELPFAKDIDPNGLIGKWAGITFLRAPAGTLPTGTETVAYRSCPMYVGSGIQMVYKGTPRIEIQPLVQYKGFPNGILIEGEIGGARIQDKKVVEIRSVV